MLAFSFLISSSFTVGEAITGTLDPKALTFLRFVLAAFILFLISRFSGSRFPVPTLRHWPIFFWLGFLVMAYFVLMFEALRLTSSLNTSAIFTLGPVVTWFLSRLFLGQRLTAVQALALITAGFGALWVLLDGDIGSLGGFRPGWGEVLFFTGTVFYAAYSPSIRLFGGSIPLPILTYWTFWAAAVLLLMIGFSEISAAPWLSVPWWTYLGILHLAVFTTLCSFYLIQYASRLLPSARVMAYTYLIPAFVVLQNLVVKGEVPAASVLFGVLIIAVAMIILQKPATHS